MSSRPNTSASWALRFRAAIVLFIAPVLLSFASLASAERIKDIASFEGVRENQLTGYGIVVGLDGSGDKGNATLQTLANLMRRMGVTVKPTDIKSKNAAAVMVTATLPPFPKPGLKLDALVSTLGDAKSLQGGTLLATPLRAADGSVYAAAQGAVSIGGFIGGGGGTTVQKNHLTSGRVPGGAMIETEPHFLLGDGDEIRLFLHRPDFTTAAEAARKINQAFKSDVAATTDPSTVRLWIPVAYRNRIVDFMAVVEGVELAVDTAARVIINERTGTVVIGDAVRIAPVAIAHGNLTIEIKTSYSVSQPPPFAPGRAQTVIVPKSEVSVKEQNASLIPVAGVTLGEVVRALNALGVTPRDLVSILQGLKSSGSLRAELEII